MALPEYAKRFGLDLRAGALIVEGGQEKSKATLPIEDGNPDFLVWIDGETGDG